MRWFQSLTPETKLELEQRNRNSFYDLRPVIIQDNLIYESATSADQIELENEVVTAEVVDNE